MMGAMSDTSPNAVPVDPIARRKTYELVAERLVDMIAEGVLRSGDALATERELTERFAVGRSSVREALRMLESQGVIRAAGGGSFVVAEAMNPLNSSLRLLFALDEGTGLHDLFELRRILECEAAALAAERKTPEDLTEMDAATDGMAVALADSGHADGFIDADLRFHLAVAGATGNRLVVHSMHAVRDVIRRALLTVFRIPQSPENAVVEHRKIRDAIAAGDAARARDEMAAHLARVELDVHRGGGDG
jgi:GntR family transcriptional repressor for pyruvate dehydrogenase complex